MMQLKFPQFPATDVPQSAGQSEQQKWAPIMTADSFVKVHISPSKYLRVGDLNQLCAATGWLESELACLFSSVSK